LIVVELGAVHVLALRACARTKSRQTGQSR